MANKTISQLPAAASADPNASVAADNAAGTLTEKVTLQQIADLAAAGYDFLTSDETLEEPFAASSLSLTLASGCDYVVEGMAVISNPASDEHIHFALRLLAMDEDGEVYLEWDSIAGESGAIFRQLPLLDQSIASVVVSTYADQTYRIPFRALVRVSPSVSSTDIKVWYGGSGDYPTLHGGSWMSARRVTLDN